MDKGFINVTKVKYSFQDGNECSGIELSLAPKVKKFINLNHDNLQLLQIMGNGLYQWYLGADFGDDIVLSALVTKEKVVIPVE